MMLAIRSQPSPCPILIGLLISIILLLSFFSLFVSPDFISNRCWRGYYTVLVKSPMLSREAVSKVEYMPGVQAVVSKYSSSVIFNTFWGFESVEIDALKERLDTVDLRFDPYLKSVSNYFQVVRRSNTWSLIYIRSDLSPILLYSRLHALFSDQGTHWRLLEFDAASKILLSILFLIYSVTVIGIREKPVFRLMDLAALVPWFMNLITGDYLDLIAFFLIYPAWVLFREAFMNYLNNPGSVKAIIFRSFIFISIIALANLLIMNPAGYHCIKSLTALAANLLLIPLHIRLAALKRNRAFHPVYEPRFILNKLKPRDRIINRKKIVLVLLTAVTLLSFPVEFIEKKTKGLSAPMPLRVKPEEEISWSSLGRLSMLNTHKLPNLADYITHIAYQQGLTFGRPYGFPHPGERIYISNYQNAGQGNEIIKTFRVVKRFKESWLSETIAGAQVGSIERMLINQEEAVQVIIQEEIRVLLKKMSAFKIILISVFLIFSLYIWNFYLTPHQLYGIRSFTLWRKRHTV